MIFVGEAAGGSPPAKTAVLVVTAGGTVAFPGRKGAQGALSLSGSGTVIVAHAAAHNGTVVVTGGGRVVFNGQGPLSEGDLLALALIASTGSKAQARLMLLGWEADLVGPTRHTRKAWRRRLIREGIDYIDTH